MMHARNPLMFTTLCFILTAPAAAFSQRIEATYNFVWKGMLVSTAETTAEIGDDAYSLNAEVRMRGLAKLFAGSDKTSFSASGLVGQNGDIRPQEYNSNGNWKGHAYTESLTYDVEGNLSAIVKDWPEKWQKENAREPVPQALQNGYDPASMFVALMRRQLPIGSMAVNSKPAVYRVFDGDTVVSWSVNCANTPVRLKKTRHSAGGQAHECVFSKELLAGELILPVSHKVKKQGSSQKRRTARGRRAGNKAYSGPLKVWMRPLKNSEFWVPVQALVPSEKGAVKMYLKKLAMVVSDTDRLAMNTSSR